MIAFLVKIAAFIADISPKVKAGLNWGTGAGLLVEIASLVTPQMLSWSGAFEPLLFALIPLVAGQIAAWIKTDPFRNAGKAKAAEDAAKAQDAAAANVVTSSPVASTTAVSRGLGTTVQSEVVTPASVVVQAPPAELLKNTLGNLAAEDDQHPVQ